MEPTHGSDRNPDPNPSERGDSVRPPVRRVIRQRQPPAERGRPQAPPAKTVAPPDPVTSAPQDSGPRLCPFCGEEVSTQAVVCRHCGRDLVAGSGARLVLPAEKWNTNVPPWMLEKEREFLQRRQKISHLKRWGRQGVLAAIVIGVGAVLYAAYTLPVTPRPQLHVAGKYGHESSASRLAMASADQKHAEATAPAATEPTPPDTSTKATPSSETPAVLTAANLVKRFEVDHDHANELYLDQLVRISGRVETLHTETEVPYLTLHSPTATELRCYLSSAAVGKLNRLRPGATILIQGRCQGWFNNIAIADCDLP